MSDISGLEAAIMAIGKRQGLVELEWLEYIPDVSVVEGDEPDTWHLCMKIPYRELKYSEPLSEWEAMKRLRQFRSRYNSLVGKTEREMTWIKGE